MLRPSHLALALTFSTAVAASEWHKCPLFSRVGNETYSIDNYPRSRNATVECLELQVPVCYPGVCTSDKTLSVFLKRMPAIRPTTPAKAVWLMQGGPGAPSDAMEGSMVEIFAAANGTTSLYTMDHRGVGRSSPLTAHCPEMTDENVMRDDATAAAAYSNCFQKLKDLYGSGFSVTSAATDLASIIESPMLANDDVYVYGVSYGTYLVERLMHLAPKNVKGYILDSMLAESPLSPYSDWDRDVAKVETTYYGLCDRDPVCSSKIGPNSKKFAFDLFTKLDANDTACAQAIYAAKGLPSDFFGSMFSNMIISYTQRNLIPAILYRVAQCVKEFDSNDRFLHGLLGLSTDETSDDRGDIVPGNTETGESASDDLLYNNIVFNEIWELPSPSFERFRDDAAKITWRASPIDGTKANIFKFCAFRGHSDPVCHGLGLDAPKQTFAYSHDQYWNKTAAVPTGASALLLSGAIDIQTIPEYAVIENATMAGDKKLLLQFPFGGHSIISTTPTDAKY
ncbi:hypothetical protein SDRG_00321 [Saprolegnia diclina VS20]|uniref:AB hydrolase-1 domain-containing protein n=1 Tax=Saprolegnia diclina (strain VS20) TaxID=1156394 RepID=T0SIA7_SAPDV|nr:hypothetical protein SDRG_00321 [Saprolegnia diclina VS20]EQC42592.1 hypothetical protein SDRG_00321 [Saprolegnia diclina VS20]|eukprot:XP_008604015.1 hypothetical protein SDRG_00321 [Saprolegnia diclina VS20]